MENILQLEGDKLSSKLSALDQEISALDEQIKQLSLTKSLLKKDRARTSKTLYRINKLRIQQDKLLQEPQPSWFKKLVNRDIIQKSEKVIPYSDDTTKVFDQTIALIEEQIQKLSNKEVTTIAGNSNSS